MVAPPQAPCSTHTHEHTHKSTKALGRVPNAVQAQLRCCCEKVPSIKHSHVVQLVVPTTTQPAMPLSAANTLW